MHACKIAIVNPLGAVIEATGKSRLQESEATGKRGQRKLKESESKASLSRGLSSVWQKVHSRNPRIPSMLKQRVTAAKHRFFREGPSSTISSANMKLIASEALSSALA
jgi:hypothetical protein